MARRNASPRISIQADADGVGRATRQAEGHLDRLGKSGEKSLHGLKTAALATGAALAGGAVLGLKASAEAAIESEKANARLQAQLDALGISYDKHADKIQRTIDAHSRLSGFDDEDLGDSFTNIVRVVGNVDKALELNRTAMDLARAKHIDVAKAADIVGKVAGGNTGILKRYGVVIDDGASKSEALAALQKKFAGQAEAYGKTTAGSADRAKVAFENLGESLGAKVTPLIAKGADALAEFIGQMTRGEGPGGRVRAVFEGLGTAAGTAFGGVRSLVTGFQDGEGPARALASAVGGLALGFAAFKVGGAVVAGLAATKGAIVGIGTAMKANPFGLALGVLGSLIGSIGIFTAKTRDNTLTQRELNDVYRSQIDTMRRLRDIDIDVAQRRANLKSANVAVEQAERSLGEARKQYGRNSLEARQAEADLKQAVVSQTRARREAARSEQDHTETRRQGTEQTAKDTRKLKEHNESVQRDIDLAQGRIRALEQQKAQLKAMTGQTDDTIGRVRELTRRQERLREEIERLHAKKVSVTVAFKLAPSPGSVYGSQQAAPSTGQGDGIGARAAVHGSVRRLAQSAADSGRLLPVGPASLMGADPDLAPFASIASGFGLVTSSGLRPGAITSSGNRSYHASGDAIDETGPPSAMMRFAQAMSGMFGGRLRELIYTPLGRGQIKDGRPYVYSGQVAQDHYDHVHVAYTGPFGDGEGQPGVVRAFRRAIRDRKANRLEQLALWEAGIVESGLRNLRYGDADSLGALQERESIYGRAHALDPYKSAVRFLREAQALRPWHRSAGALAQAVQRSRYPGRYDAAKGRALKFLSPAAAKGKGKGGELGVKLGPMIEEPPPPLHIEGDNLLLDGGGGAAGGGGDDGTSRLADAIEQSNAIQAEIAANQKRLIYLAEVQGPQIVGAVVAAVNGSIGQQLAPGLQGLRSPAGSVAGY